MLTDKEKQELAALESKVNVQLVSAGSGLAQANAAMKLFEANGGQVTTAQLATINAKYPSDPVYYARKLFGANIATARAKGGKTTYKLLISLQETKRLAELRAKASQASQATGASAGTSA